MTCSAESWLVRCRHYADGMIAFVFESVFNFVLAHELGINRKNIDLIIWHFQIDQANLCNQRALESRIDSYNCNLKIPQNLQSLKVFDNSTYN